MVATPAVLGAEVAAGAPVLVLESMKMENTLLAPFAARVKELLVSVGSQVEVGAPLLRLEPTGGADEVPAEGGQVDLDLPVQDTQSDDATTHAARLRADLGSMMLGFDVDPRDEGHTLSDYLNERDGLVAQDDSPIADELALVETFADFADLSRNRPLGEDVRLENRVHSPREHFHTYLQSLDPDRGALPEDFRHKLERVLQHYGVADLERTPRLEAAVFRIFLAQQRSGPDVALVTALLRRWIAEPAPSEPAASEARDALDRLVRATQLRFPAVGDLARSVHFRWFDQPLVDQERESVLDGVGRRLHELSGMPTGPERDARTDEPGRHTRAVGALPRRGPRGRRVAHRRADARRAGQAPLSRARPARLH